MTSKKKVQRRAAVDGLPDAAYTFFGDGPFFDGEDYENATTDAERADLWERYRETIIARWHGEHPEQSDRKTWGEVLEDMKASARRAHPANPFKPELVR